MSEYKPGVYAKDGVERVARTAPAAVALVFEGFKLKEEGAKQESVETPAEQPKADEPVKDEAPKPRSPKQTPTEKKD